MTKTMTPRTRISSLNTLMAAVDTAMAEIERSGGEIEDVLKDAGVIAARAALRRRGGVSVLSDTDTAARRGLRAA